MLRLKDSPLSHLMTAELPDISAVRKSYRAKVAVGLGADCGSAESSAKR